jgi:hypothetical protein
MRIQVVGAMDEQVHHHHTQQQLMEELENLYNNPEGGKDGPIQLPVHRLPLSPPTNPKSTLHTAVNCRKELLYY